MCIRDRPIIDRETWERVQELRKQRKRPNRYDEVGLFSGMLFCTGKTFTVMSIVPVLFSFKLDSSFRCV